MVALLAIQSSLLSFYIYVVIIIALLLMAIRRRYNREPFSRMEKLRLFVIALFYLVWSWILVQMTIFWFDLELDICLLILTFPLVVMVLLYVFGKKKYSPLQFTVKEQHKMSKLVVVNKEEEVLLYKTKLVQFAGDIYTTRRN